MLVAGATFIIYFFYVPKLNLYTCEDAIFADSCFKCSIVKDQKVDFLVDQKLEKVLLRSYGYAAGKELNLGSSVIENCKIFDSKNWDCSNAYMLGPTYINDHKAMTNGIYSSYSYWAHKIQKDGIQCAK